MHHDHLVGKLTHYGEVVTDEHEGHTSLVADVGEQVEHLGLDRHVECRDGLVEDEDLRLSGQGSRDRDALALPPESDRGRARDARSSNPTSPVSSRTLARRRAGASL